MQREIKFRGKTKTGEWVYGVPLSTRDQAYIIQIIEDSVNIGKFLFHNIEVIPETVGQFIGKADRKGKGIFQKDIVKLWRGHFTLSGRWIDSKSPEIAEVMIENASVIFRVKNKAVPMFSENRNRTYGIETEKCVEVIGNSIDNPELLDK